MVLGLLGQTRFLCPVLYARCCVVNLFFRFLHRRLEILLHHFHFLLNHVELRLNRLLQIVRRFFKSFHGLAHLTPDLRQLLGPEEQERNDQDYENFTSAKTRTWCSY